LRIAQLIETMGTGGAEKLAVDIAGARFRCGDESTLITLSGLGPSSEGMDPGIAVFTLSMNPHNVFSQLATLFRLLRLCRRLRLDALQTHLPRANFFGLALALLAGIPVFPTVHNNREFDYGNHPGSLRKRLRRFAYGRMLVHCRKMIAVSDAVKQAVIQELNLDQIRSRRIEVVPNGVAVPEPLTPLQRAEVRREFGVPDGCTLIVGVGRLTPQKNFQDLISALGQLDQDTPCWNCIIAGDGPLREELAELVRAKGLQDRVQLAGRISAVDRLLGAADIFCMSSLWEGLPLALLEAMAAALPVAAYAIDGVCGVVNAGRCGFLATPGKPNELSIVLGQLLDGPQSRIEMGCLGRTVVEKEYSLNQVAKKLGRIYLEQGGHVGE